MQLKADLLIEPGAEDCSRTQGAQDWSRRQGAQDCSRTQGAQDWSPTQGAQDWSRTQGAQDWSPMHRTNAGNLAPQRPMQGIWPQGNQCRESGPKATNAGNLAPGRQMQGIRPQGDQFIIIIIIKKYWQCKVGRGRLTPYQFEDPRPTLPTYRGKEEKGKIVENQKG